MHIRFSKDRSKRSKNIKVDDTDLSFKTKTLKTTGIKNISTVNTNNRT